MNLLDLNALWSGFTMASTPGVLIAIALGMLTGVVVGAIPGIKGTTAIAILLPFTNKFPPIISIMFLSSIYTAATYGGGITAVLMGIPGTAGGIMTVFDGYEMTRNGRQNEALGIGLICSCVGCFVGYLFLMFTIKSIGAVVLKFGPGEMLMIVLFAISVIGILNNDILECMYIGVLGLLLGTVGATAYGSPRGIFGILPLFEGIPLAAVSVAIMALAQVMLIINKKSVFKDEVTVQRDFADILRGFRLPFVREKLNMLVSSVIGIVIGLLPAAGASVAATVSYGYVKKISKHKDNFGKGEPAGLVAAETSNNACEGGAMTTMMAFGVPGSGATALMMAAFIIAGFAPGPYMLRQSMDVVYSVIWGNLFGAFILVGVGLVFISYFSKVIFVPMPILATVITVLAVVGTFSSRQIMVDVYVLAVFLLLGVLLKLADYSIMALILGFILGTNLDAQLSRVIALYGGRYEMMFSRPLFVALFLLNVAVFLSPVYKKLRSRPKESKAG